MRDTTMDFLKNNISSEQMELLRGDPDVIRSEMSNQTDEQRLENAGKQHDDAQSALLLAIHKAESHGNDENIKKVIRNAVKADDFVTALYWHQKKLRGKTTRVSDKFERYYYTLMAEQQKEQNPSTKPCTDVRQMCQMMSDTSHSLRDPEYLEQSIRYRTELAKTYQAEFDAAEQSIFLRAKKKNDNATWLQLLVTLLLVAAGVVCLWNTYGIVSAWARETFRFTILFLISWAIPILYALIVIALLIALWYLLVAAIGSRSEKRLKNSLAGIKYRIERHMETTEAYRALQSMNGNLPKAFHSYDSRLLLAARSAMSGEQNLEKLYKMTQSGTTWLTRQYPPENWGKQPYEAKMNSLIQKNASDSDLFVGYTLYRKQSPAAADCDQFISSFLNVFFGRIGDTKEEILFHMVERFLQEEALLAEKCGNHARMGEAYYELYDMYTHASTLFSDSWIYRMAYQYGSLGVNHCDALKYKVMYNYACYNRYEEYYNPYLSLGYTRTDAGKYAEELKRKGDPRGRQLEERFADVDKRARERAIEAENAEARAFWEQKSRLMKEAEEAREQARSELNARMDSIEREANLLFRGSYSTEEERALRGEQSEMDRIRHQDFRDAVIREKLNDM